MYVHVFVLSITHVHMLVRRARQNLVLKCPLILLNPAVMMDNLVSEVDE